MGCSGPEADQLFSIFDKNRSGTINFEEFIVTILGELNHYRLNIIHQAFHSLDKNGSGTLDVEEIKAKFDPSRHPDCQTGSRTVDDCKYEFLDMFSTHHTVTHNFQSEKTVSLQEFIEYHHHISSFIESDKMFKVFMSGVWNMDLVDTEGPVIIGGAPVRPAGVTPQIYGKNSREQWKYDFHRSFFGQLNATPMKQDI